MVKPKTRSVPNLAIPQESMSLKREQNRSLRSELEYFKKQLADAGAENRTLRQLLLRQEAALSKIDGQRNGIVIGRYAEEIRVLKEQLRSQREKNRDQERVLRERNDHLQKMIDRVKYLDKLLKDQGVDPKKKKQEARTVEDLEAQLEERSKRIQVHKIKQQNLILI